MILTICPYYKTGRKCTHKDYCCEKVDNNCMSDMYYAIDLKTENRHLNDLLNQALKENDKLREQLADKQLDYASEYNRKVEEKGYRVFLEQKLEKIKVVANSTFNDGVWNGFEMPEKLRTRILQIISEEEE